MRPCKVARTIHGFSLGYVAAAASSPSERSRKKASIQPSGLFYISLLKLFDNVPPRTH
jgi:hypothetical protein